MQMGGVWYLDGYYSWAVPIFPIVTLLGALGISLVELKSIYEKADEKVKGDYQDVALLVAEIAKHKADPTEIAQAVVEYMNRSMEEKK